MLSAPLNKATRSTSIKALTVFTRSTADMADVAAATSAATARKRRRLVISCLECHRRKQKCDRGDPCGNCVARGVGDYCAYESEPKSVNTQSSNGSDGGISSSPNNVVAKDDMGGSAEMMQDIENFGYTWTNPLNSMGMLKRALDATCNDALCGGDPMATHNSLNSLNIQYRGYVRRIPTKPYCERLLENFFKAVNWQYFIIEEVIFRAQLQEWWNTAYIVLNRGGPADLSSEMQYFPALLFQVLALSLQFLPPRYDGMLEDLKFGAGQTFSELSSEYSDCGSAIVSLLGRYRPNLACVQQEFLRASWLKNMGRVIEAWHTIGLAVKEAQEVGLHKEPIMPSMADIKQVNATLWQQEVRRRVWLNLVLWDLQMSLILGRPMSIHLSDCTVSKPVHDFCPTDITERPPMPQDLSLSKPSPLVHRLIDYKIAMLLPEIRSLEIQGSAVWDDPRIQQMHQMLIDTYNEAPAYLRHRNPDTQWDKDCPYLPAQRETLFGTVQTTLLALNRLYIFKSESSRRIVLQAALESLDSQKRLFQIFDAQHYKLYTLSFNTFDAAILLSVVLLSFPLKSAELFTRAAAALNDAHGRLRFLGDFIPLAKTGSNVIGTLIERIQTVRRTSASTGNVDSPDAAKEIEQGITPQSQDTPSRTAGGSMSRDYEATRAWLDQTPALTLTSFQDQTPQQPGEPHQDDWFDMTLGPASGDQLGDGGFAGSSSADGAFLIPLPLKDLAEGDVDRQMFGSEFGFPGEDQLFQQPDLAQVIDPALLKAEGEDLQPPAILALSAQQLQMASEDKELAQQEGSKQGDVVDSAPTTGQETAEEPSTALSPSAWPANGAPEDLSFWSFLNNIPTPNPTTTSGA